MVEQQTAFQTFLTHLPPDEAASLQKAATTLNSEGFLAEVGHSLRAHKDLGLEGFTSDAILNSARAHFDEQFPSNPQPENPTTPTPPESTFSVFGKREKKPNPSEGVHTGDSVTPQIISIQENHFLDEFDKVMAIQDEDEQKRALDELLLNIDAPSLLHDQWKIINDHLEQPGAKEFLGMDDEEHQKLLTQLQEQRDEKKKQWQNDQEKLDQTKEGKEYKEDLAKKEAKLRDALNQARELGDNEDEQKRALAEKAREDFHDILSHRLAQVQGYSVVTEYVELPNAFVFNLGRFLQIRQRQQMEASMRAQQEELSEGPAREGLYGPGKTGTPPKNSRRSQLKNLANRALNNPVAKALLQATPVGRGILAAKKAVDIYSKHKIAIWIGVCVGIFILLLPLIALILIVIMTVSGVGSGPQQAVIPPGQCTNNNICLQQLSSLGIHLNGDLSLNGDPLGKVTQIYNTIELVSQSPSQYVSLLHLSQNPVTITVYASGCAGHSNYNGVDFFGWCNNSSVNRFILLHELGHVLAFRNPKIFGKFYIEGLAYNLFSSVFSPLAMPTFNCLFDYGIGPFPGECWADSVAEYVTYPYYRDTVGGRPAGEINFPNFPTFDNGFYYNFMSQNIYNGADYSKVVAP